MHSYAGCKKAVTEDWSVVAISHSKLNPHQDDLMYAHVINSSQKMVFFVVDCEITNIHCVRFDDSLATIQTTQVSYFVVPHSNPLSKLQAVDMSGYTSKSGRIKNSTGRNYNRNFSGDKSILHVGECLCLCVRLWLSIYVRVQIKIRADLGFYQ